MMLDNLRMRSGAHASCSSARGDIDCDDVDGDDDDDDVDVIAGCADATNIVTIIG